MICNIRKILLNFLLQNMNYTWTLNKNTYPELRLRSDVWPQRKISQYLAKKLKDRGSSLYSLLFLISYLLRLAFAIVRKPQACCCGQTFRPQFGVKSCIKIFIQVLDVTYHDKLLEICIGAWVFISDNVAPIWAI